MFQRTTHLIALAVLITLSGVTVTFATTPSLVNYQGELADAASVPLVGTFTVTFSIYDAANAANPALWSETRSVTTGAQGRFNVLLGSVTALTETVFSGPDRWLGTRVNPDASDLVPRTRIATVAYAFRPATVDGASGGNITSSVSIGPEHVNTGGNAFITGDHSIASGYASAVCGGTQSVASGANSAVLGGYGNTASGVYSAVCGGYLSTAAGNHSVAAGFGAQALHDYSFVWGEIATSQGNQFLVANNLGVSTNSTPATLNISEPATPNLEYVREGLLGAGVNIITYYYDNHYTPGVFWSTENNNADKPKAGIFMREASNGTDLILGTSNDYAVGITNSGLIINQDGNAVVSGDICADNHACPSDARFKRDIETLHDALRDVQRLRGVSYHWRSEEFPDRQLPKGDQVGLIAQEVAKVVPQAVTEQDDGYLSVDYARLVPLLIEGMKEQQRRIEKLEAKIESMTP